MPVHVAASLADALDALASAPQAHLLAGGTDLMVEVNFGHRHLDAVIAIDRVEELRGWSHDEAAGTVTMGSGLTYTAMLEPEFARLVPAMADAARTVGSPQIRNAGTIGGNLGTCSPAGDALPVLSALDATVQLASAASVRSIDVHDFMLGVKRTALAPGELLVSATVPVVDGWQGYAKVGVRNAMVIAVASACLVADRRARTVRLALGAVGPTIVRARQAEEWVSGEVSWDGGSIEPALAAEFGRRAAVEARPIDDHRSTAAYRRHAVEVMAARLLRRGFG
jgi:CO/xanthine dehydrogenase FAD-binding subunit